MMNRGCYCDPLQSSKLIKQKVVGLKSTNVLPFYKTEPPTQSVGQPTGSQARNDNTYDNNLAGNNNVDTCITPVYTKDYTMAPGEPRARPTHT